MVRCFVLPSVSGDGGEGEQVGHLNNIASVARNIIVTVLAVARRGS